MSDPHRLTRIYTRTGDQGTTRLVGGEEVSKADARVEAYGSVDELSSCLGVVRAELRRQAMAEDVREELDRDLKRIQNELFRVGAELATAGPDAPGSLARIGEAEWRVLEQAVDRMNSVLGPLREFLLPGGGILGAHLHLARATCRRAERRAVAAALPGDGQEGVRAYLNRLSDYLFVLARWAARATGDAEEMWERGA